MKKILISVISYSKEPWLSMLERSINTWDSITVPNVETNFFCGGDVFKENGNVSYFPISEEFPYMAERTLLAFEYYLKTKEFDYLVRINSSMYVNKNSLWNFVDNLQGDVFGRIALPCNSIPFDWIHGYAFILNRNTVQDIVINKEKLIPFNKDYFHEDVMLSKLIQDTGHKLTNIKIPHTVTLNNNGGYSIVSDDGRYDFSDFNKIKDYLKQCVFLRCKQKNRNKDKNVMEGIYKSLK